MYKGEQRKAELLLWSKNSNPNKEIDKTHSRLMELRKGGSDENSESGNYEINSGARKFITGSGDVLAAERKCGLDERWG